jgi:hypothetical protein
MTENVLEKLFEHNRATEHHEQINSMLSIFRRPPCPE